MPSLSLDRALDPERIRLLTKLGRLADKTGAKLWAVGGIVRDALLGKRVVDIDLTSEMRADLLGPTLAEALGGTVNKFTRFGTAKLHVDGHTFDLATTRTETYPTPASLPVVEIGRIEDDLARRDFTINAMAVSLAPADFGAVLDLHGGRDDLDAKRVRVLHPQSFRDDPTRAFREVRYAVRLGFRVEGRTAGWMRRDAHYIERLTPARVRHELERILAEEAGAAILMDAHRRGLLAQVHPSLDTLAIFDALRRAKRAKLNGLVLLAALMYPLSLGDADAVEHRLGLSKRQRAVGLAAARLRLGEANIREATASGVYALMGSAPREAFEAAMAVGSDHRARQAVSTYLKRLRKTGTHLTGADLLAMGIPQGPAMGIALRSLRAAELDGAVRSRTGALRFVRKLIQEE